MRTHLPVIVLLAILIQSPAQADIHWNWVNAGTGTEWGTIITTGDVSGGEVLAGSYTLLDFTLAASNYGLPVGSFLAGEYSIGQPDLGIEWDGTAITQFWRSSGLYTNGFSLTVTNPEIGAPDNIVMNIDYFVVELYDDSEFLNESQTPVFTPVTPPQPGIIWNWSNITGGGTEVGTFTTLGTLDEGSVSAGSYEIIDFTVTSSGFGLPVGSYSGGQYTLGQPGLGFVWDGSFPTEFWRADGTYTNGIAFYVANPEEGAPNRCAMGIGSFIVDILYGTVFVSEGAPVIITPEGATLPVSEVSFGGLKALYR